MKIDVERALAAPTPRGGSLSAAEFHKSEWEIMYPLFVEEERRLMFCIFAMTALIFVLPTLCCVPSRACLCSILLSAAFIMRACVSRLRAGFLPAFMRLLIHLL
jgi:hypothetical protein